MLDFLTSITFRELSKNRGPLLWTDYDAAKEYQPRGNPEMEKAAGFQLMNSQISHYRFLQQWITDQNVRIIHLFRQNVLRTYFSSIKAKQTGQYHVSNKTISQQKILINPKTIIDDLSRLINEQEMSKNRFPNNPYLEFTYEQFFSDHYQNITEEIFAFLEIEKAEVKFPTWLKKLNPGPLEELIENYILQRRQDEDSIVGEDTLWRDPLRGHALGRARTWRQPIPADQAATISRPSSSRAHSTSG